MMEYTLIRSNRRTVSMEVKPNGEVIVRAPHLMPLSSINEFVTSHTNWVEKTKARIASKQASLPPPLTSEDIELLVQKAKEILPKRVQYYAGIMGLPFPRIKVTHARTRYGSCSSKNNISFSIFLMANDFDSIDYVVVHELSHIRNKNHSKNFWDEVASVLPNYKERKKKLFMPRIEII